MSTLRKFCLLIILNMNEIFHVLFPVNRKMINKQNFNVLGNNKKPYIDINDEILMGVYDNPDINKNTDY